MKDFKVTGRFWVKKGAKNFLGEGKVELLRRIQETGSISKAAKLMRMSYKAAWDDVDMMNNLSDVPLVIREAGGKRGGGTKLTQEAVALLEYFDSLQSYFDRFVSRISESEKNSFPAHIVRISDSLESTELTLALDGGGSLYVSLPGMKKQFTQDDRVTAKIPPDSFIIFPDSCGGCAGAANTFKCKVDEVSGEAPMDIVLRSENGLPIHVELKKDAWEKLNLAKGGACCAVCSEYSIWLEPVGWSF